MNTPASLWLERLKRLVLRCARIHRYPRYIADFGATYVLPQWLKSAGLSVGPGTRFAGLPIMSLAPRSRISIGRDCRIISRSSNTALGVNHPTIFRTLRPGASIRLGDGVRASGLTLCSAQNISVGDRCVIGANATIVDTDFHSLDPRIRNSPNDAQGARSAPVIIGADVFIGGGAFILKGVNVGAGSVIGAATVVTKDVPAGATVAGNPARIMRNSSLVPTSSDA